MTQRFVGPSLAALVLLSGGGCKDAKRPSGSPTNVAAPSNADGAEARALARARSAAQMLGKTLKRTLVGTITRKGIVAALAVCADQAQSLTRQVHKRTGVRVGRSSLRLRNPNNAGPPWVTRWLNEQGARKALGAKGFARIDTTPSGKVARVLAPIAVLGPCTGCHGSAGAIAPKLREILRTRYPKDRALGYSAGDLRGAVWAELAVGSVTD